MASAWWRLFDHWETLKQTVDVTKIVPQMTLSVKFSLEDFEELMDLEQTHERAQKLLEMVVQRGPLAFMAFRDALAKNYPNLYLLLVDCQGDDQLLRYDSEHRPIDEWYPLHQWRHLLLAELRASEVVPDLLKDGVLGQAEAEEVMQASPDKQTEVLLDVLETLDPLLIDPFLDVIAGNYPHLYLTLTGFESAQAPPRYP